MIAHFIMRDFRTFKFHWIVLIGISLFASPLVIFSTNFLDVLGYAYFFFGLVPQNNLTGVSWRSQHIMSRNYLLALPVERKKLFLIIQYRALVYFAPFMIYCLTAPFFSTSFARGMRISSEMYPIYAIMVVFGIIWTINAMIYSQLGMEKANSYQTPQQRAKSHFKNFAIYFFEVTIIISAFFNRTILNLNLFLPLIVVFTLAVIRYIYTRRWWLGTA